MRRLDPLDQTAILSLKVPARLLKRLKREAARRRAGTVSTILRSLIVEWLDREARHWNGRTPRGAIVEPEARTRDMS